MKRRNAGWVFLGFSSLILAVCGSAGEEAKGPGASRFRHKSWISQVAWSPDGGTLASGSQDGTARLWEAATGEEIRSLDAGMVLCLAFSPDGKTLAVGGTGPEPTLRLWDVATGKMEVLDGGKLACNFGIDTLAVAFSPDGRWLAAGNACGTVRLWDRQAARKEPVLLLRHEQQILSLAFLPDGERLASAGLDGRLCLWDLAKGNLEEEFRGGGLIAFAFSPDGKTLAFQVHGDPRCWDIMGQEFAGKQGQVPGKTREIGAPDGLIHLRDLAKNTEIAVCKGHQVMENRACVTSLRFSPDGKTLASTGWDGTLRLWDPATGQQKSRTEEGEDPLQLVKRLGDPDFKVREAAQKALEAQGARAVPALREAAKSGDLEVASRAKDVLEKALAMEGYLLHCAFSPDGKTVAASGGPCVVLLMSADSGKDPLEKP